MKADILSTLLGVITPLSIPVIAGVVLTRWKRLDSRPLLVVALYVLSPGIIFHTLSTAELSLGDVTGSILFSIVNIALLWTIAKAMALALRLPAPETAGLTLMATMTNCVNYGLPLVLLAFGKLGLDKASFYVVIQMVFVNTVGVYLAARSRFSVKAAVRSVFSLPAIYAMVLAVALRSSGLALPSGVTKGLSMIAEAYSPMVLLILGSQMAAAKGARLEASTRRAFWSGMALRMAIAPVVAWLVTGLLGIDGMLRSVLVIEASMPVAVNSVILAEKFDAAPRVVSTCILWTTLASFAALPLLISLVK